MLAVHIGCHTNFFGSSNSYGCILNLNSCYYYSIYFNITWKVALNVTLLCYRRIYKISCIFAVCDLGKVDCVFVLDNSISIENDTNFGLIRGLVIQITQQLTIGLDNSLVSVIIFARHAAINFTLTEHTTRTELIDAINQISYFDLPELSRTGTNIPDALNLLRTGGQDGSIGLRGNANFSHVIFITDGRANTIDLEEERTGMNLRGQPRRDHRRQDEANTLEAAERLHDAGIYNETFAIGIRGTHDINLEELEAIASRPEFVFEIEDFTPEAFQAVALQLVDEICTRKNICIIM